MQIETKEVPGRAEHVDRPVVAPRCDIYESDDDILLLADLPGVSEEGVRLNLDRGELSLEADTRLEEPQGEPFAVEFGNVVYRRTFLVPKDIDATNITADLKDGVLKVRLPKHPAAQARKIQVQAIQ